MILSDLEPRRNLTAHPSRTMETPLRSVRKKAFSILDSTSFPDAATNTKSQLHHINITPINFDRTSNPHRMHTFHEASPERIETLINNNNTDEVSGTLTSSGIDSLADRVASLLGKPANFDPFETPNAKQTDSDDSKTIQKSVPLQDEDSSLQLLSKSIMNATHFNTSTNFVVPALATHDIRSPLQTLPFDQNNNNENNSSSSSDISNNPISFSSSSIRDYHSDREESKQTSEEVPYQRPPLTLPPRLSTIIEASKSTDSISRNSGSIILEADRLLETINRLLSNKSRSQNQSTIDSLRKAASVQSAHSLSIPEQPSEKGDSTRKSSQASPNVNTEPDAICIEASDAETEYLEPPVEPPNARPMLSQTYNSHIYTSNKRKGKTATTASATAAASERQPRLAPNKRTTEQTTPPDSVATIANTRPFIKPPPPAVHRTTVSSSSSSSSSSPSDDFFRLPALNRILGLTFLAFFFFAFLCLIFHCVCKKSSSSSPSSTSNRRSQQAIIAASRGGGVVICRDNRRRAEGAAGQSAGGQQQENAYGATYPLAPRPGNYLLSLPGNDQQLHTSFKIEMPPPYEEVESLNRRRAQETLEADDDNDNNNSQQMSHHFSPILNHPPPPYQEEEEDRPSAPEESV